MTNGLDFVTGILTCQKRLPSLYEFLTDSLEQKGHFAYDIYTGIAQGQTSRGLKLPLLLVGHYLIAEASCRPSDLASVGKALLSVLNSGVDDSCAQILGETAAFLLRSSSNSEFRTGLVKHVAGLAESEKPSFDFLMTLLDASDGEAEFLVSQTLSTCYEIFTQGDSDDSTREETLKTLYLAFKVAAASGSGEVDFGPSASQWGGALASVVAAGGGRLRRGKVFAARLAGVALRDMPRTAGAFVAPVLSALLKGLPTLAASFVGEEVEADKGEPMEDEGLAESFEGSTTTELASATLELLAAMGPSRAELRVVLPQLISAVAGFLLLPKRAEAASRRLNINPEGADLRVTTLETLHSLSERLEIEVLELLGALVTSLLREESAAPELPTLKAVPIWKRREAGLFLLSSFRELLYSNELLSESSILPTLLQILSTKGNSILKSRCLSSLAECSFRGDANDFFPAALACAAKPLSDSQITSPIARLAALRAASAMSGRLPKKYGREISVFVKSAALALGDNKSVFGPLAAPFAVNLLGNIEAMYPQEFGREVAQQGVVEPMVAAMARTTGEGETADKLAALITKLASDPSAKSAIFTSALGHIEKLLPCLLRGEGGVGAKSIQSEGKISNSDIQTENTLSNTDIQSLGIKVTSVACGDWQSLPSANRPDEAIASLLPLLSRAVRAGEPRAAACLGVLADSAVAPSSADPSLLRETSLLARRLLSAGLVGAEQTNLLSTVEKILSTLLSPGEAEPRSTYVGHLLLSVVRLNPKLNAAPLWEAILSKLAKSCLPSTCLSVVLFFAPLVLKDPEGLFTTLNDIQCSGRPGFRLLLDKWLLHQPRFSGRAVRILTLRALGRLLALKNPEIDSLSVVGVKPSHTPGKNSETKFPAKVISLLVGTLLQETRAVSNDDETDSRPQSLPDDDDIEPARFEDDEIPFQNGDTAQGLAAAETGSQSYLSALLGFDDIDGDEWDPESEEVASELAPDHSDLPGEIKAFLKALKEDKRFPTWKRLLDEETLAFLMANV